MVQQSYTFEVDIRVRDINEKRPNFGRALILHLWHIREHAVLCMVHCKRYHIHFQNSYTIISSLHFFTCTSFPSPPKKLCHCLQASCHLALCHSLTCDPIVITNIIVKCICETLLKLTRVCRHVSYDLVEIRTILMRYNKWPLHTLHKSMKHTKRYLLVYLKARKCLGLNVNCSKLEWVWRL